MQAARSCDICCTTNEKFFFPIKRGFEGVAELTRLPEVTPQITISTTHDNAVDASCDLIIDHSALTDLPILLTLVETEQPILR
jgi:hypothetical protein